MKRALSKALVWVFVAFIFQLGIPSDICHEPFTNMHELGITQNIVSIVAERAQRKKVKRVLLEIGKLSAILPDAVRFCFDICTQGTVIEGAKLEIVETPGLARCQQCGAEIPLEKPFGKCACGCVHLNLIAGEELKIQEIEIEELCV